MKTTDILNISRLKTCTDGGGISTLIGFAGCPLRCAYCLNPSSWDGSVKYNRYSVDDLYNEVKKDNIYFLSTGGGLAFGGGEPLLHHDFIKEFIERYKSTGWKFTLETSLSTEQEFIEDIIEHIDFFIVDTKDMDKTRYELYTKGNYELFLSNLTYILDEVGSDKIRVRVPLIPELNSKNDIESNFNILKNIGFKDIEVFPYVEIENYKKISDVALKNKQEFLKSLK